MFLKNIATHTFTWLSSHKFTHFLTYIRHYTQSAIDYVFEVYKKLDVIEANVTSDVITMQRLSIQVQLQFFMIK